MALNPTRQTGADWCFLEADPVEVNFRIGTIRQLPLITLIQARFSYSYRRQHSTSESSSFKNSRVLARMHFEFYRVFFDARATNSSTLESKSFRMEDWFDFL